jgi:hypothetical protein
MDDDFIPRSGESNVARRFFDGGHTKDRRVELGQATNVCAEDNERRHDNFLCGSVFKRVTIDIGLSLDDKSEFGPLYEAT